MNVAMTGVTGYANLNRVIEDSAVTHRRLDALSRQVSTGLIGDTYSGLGDGASISLDLRPQVTGLQTWQNNVDTTAGRMSVAQTALTQIQTIAGNLYAQLNAVQGLNSVAVNSVAAAARDALGQVASLLDSQVGGSYVFAGQDTGNPPVPNPDKIVTSGYYTQINAAVAGLTPNGAAATANATYAVATSNLAGTSPFSTFLSQPFATVQASLPVVQIGEKRTETIGVPASANGLIPDCAIGTPAIAGGPPTSTGSYMRDVMRALATIGSLDSSQASATGFGDLVQDVRISLSGAINAMAQDAGSLGNVQTSMSTAKDGLADTETALSSQVSDAEDVDMAEAISRLTLVQTQLQASYQLIATLNGLSLTKFLSNAA